MATKNRIAQQTTLVKTSNIKTLDDIINNLDQLLPRPDISLPVSWPPMSWLPPEEIKLDPKLVNDFVTALVDSVSARHTKSATAAVPTAVASTQDAILQFLESKKAASLRPSSLKNYAQVLRWFAAEHASLPCTEQQMQAFLTSRVWADTTRLLVYKVLKDFSKFVAERFGITDAMAGIPKPRVRQKEPDCLTLSEVKLLLNAIETSRERALVYLCLGQALRISEAVSPTISDIGEDLLRIKEGKEREESMPLLPEVRDALRELAGNRNWNEPVFVGNNGHLGRDMGEHIIKKVFQRAGINGVKQSPHTLRHTFATLATNDGCDEYSLGRLLRHAKSNWNITHRYIHLGMNDLRAKLEKYSPIRLVTRQNDHSDKLLEGQGS